jgi:MinD-like ATPase involved in chromosome partitioning or flagellar assembly/AmiR/NasT family two-component response regulator
LRVIVVDNEENTFKVARELSSQFEVTNCASILAATALVEETKPEVVLVDINMRGALDFVRWLKKKTGAMVILTGPTQLTRGIKECPADGFLKKPLQKENLEDEINRIIRGGIEKEVTLRDEQQKTGSPRVVAQEVVAIWGAKGGSGRTTIAATLAHYLKDFKTLLIDLNFSNGPSDLSMYVKLPKIPHIGRFIDNPLDRRQGLLDSLTKPEQSHFAVVQPPPTIEQSDKISCEDIVDLIDQARRLFAIIILDLPCNQSPVTLEAVDMSTTVLFVTPVHYGSIARLERQKDTVDKETSRVLAINRYINSSLNPKEIAHFLDMPLAGVIKEDTNLERFIENGDLNILTKTDFGEGIGQIAANLFKIEPPRKTKKSLAEIFKR